MDSCLDGDDDDDDIDHPPEANSDATTAMRMHSHRLCSA